LSGAAEANDPHRETSATERSRGNVMRI
jgi:hypothetical protein